MKSIQYLLPQSVQILSLSVSCGLFTINPSYSQINPDNTLSNSSKVNPRGNRIEITGGTQSGRNLFHSFKDFSVPNRRTASFQQIDPSIENIFSRITGSSISRINGMVEALNRDGSVSSANLFLINPNGIIFGPNASLNIGGSFLATTANSIQFADGTQFSAVNPQTKPLLTISVPVGLQFGHSPGRIVNRSYADFNTNAPLLDRAGNPLPEPFNDLVNNPYEGLRVAPNRTIALLGGNVQFPEGELTAPAGHIEVASLASSGLVRLTQVDEGWRFNYGEQQQFGRIQLSNSDLNVSGDRAGSIQLRGEHIDVSNPSGNSSIRAYTYNGNGGTVVIQGTYLTVRNDLLSANTYGSGRGGNIRITVDQMFLDNGGQIEANTYANGEGGNILIRASEFVRIRDILRQSNGQPVRSSGPPSPSGVFARVACQSEATCNQTTGQGGNIFIATNSLQLLDGGQLSSDTYGIGNAGSITVRASNIEIIGTALETNGNSITSDTGRTAPSALSTIAVEGTRGNAGRIQISTDQLSVRDGATLQSSTLGDGNAGNLSIQATESIELIGVGAGTEVPSGLFSLSGGIPETNFEINRSAIGRAGNLRVTTHLLTVQDNAVIAVGSANPNLDERGLAGNLRITANRLQADNQARLLANTNSGRGGNINLQVSNLLSLNRNSEISTTAGSERRGGDGGNITLDTDFLIGSPNTNNDITANAFTGNGGDIQINAQSILGLSPADTLHPPQRSTK